MTFVVSISEVSLNLYTQGDIIRKFNNFITGIMPLTIMEKNIGPNTDPSGTLRFCFLSDKKLMT